MHAPPVKVLLENRRYRPAFGERDECRARCLGGQRRSGKIEPGDVAAATQIEPFGVDAGQPPPGFVVAEQFRAQKSIAAAWSWFICRDDRRLRRSEAAMRRQQQIGAVDPFDAAKPGDEMAALDDEPVNTEIGEARVERA